MAEVNTPRLMAAAKEFNIGTNTLIEFLVSKNFSADDLKPTTKLTEDMYRVLQLEFQQDKAAKQKAEQLDLPKGSSADAKKKKDEEDLSIKKKAEKAKPAAAVEEKPAEPEVKTEEIKPADTITKIDAPELEGPKVLDKIDLASIDSSTRPKKGKKKEEPEVAKTEEQPAQQVVAPESIEVVMNIVLKGRPGSIKVLPPSHERAIVVLAKILPVLQ